jgi:hypothetical protein
MSKQHLSKSPWTKHRDKVLFMLNKEVRARLEQRASKRGIDVYELMRAIVIPEWLALPTPERAQWEKFQFLMAFLDDMRSKGIWYCRRASPQESKRGYESFIDIRFKDIEKSVRRYLNLPSEEQILKEVDSDLKRIREQNKQDEIKQTFAELPKPPAEFAG